MPAYNFKPWFEEPIVAGLKTQTIRAYRKGKSRHSRPGEEVGLYVGMMRKECRRLIDPKPICMSAPHIEIAIPQSRAGILLARFSTVVFEGNTFPDGVDWEPVTDAFAVGDGFQDMRDMMSFWHKTHGGGYVFKGQAIRWHPSGVFGAGQWCPNCGFGHLDQSPKYGFLSCDNCDAYIRKGSTPQDFGERHA